MQKDGPTPVNDFNELVREVPEGRWAALSHDGTRLVGQGITHIDANEQAIANGERNAVLHRIMRRPPY